MQFQNYFVTEINKKEKEICFVRKDLPSEISVKVVSLRDRLSVTLRSIDCKE